jgi:hypothetical protein
MRSHSVFSGNKTKPNNTTEQISVLLQQVTSISIGIVQVVLHNKFRVSKYGKS